MKDSARPAPKDSALSAPKESAPFAPGDLVVYRGHGVGQVIGVETQRLGGTQVRLVVVEFGPSGMVVRIPFHKVKSAGLRPVSSAEAMVEVLAQLAQPAVAAKGVWNRRLVEYMAKVNSGDPVALAEVVRDLHPAPKGVRSPAAQTIYEKAFGRLSEELAAVDCSDSVAAAAKLELLLNAA